MGAMTIGSLCSGYGGLDLAVEEFFGARTEWFCEYEAAPSKVLAAHWPGVLNLGDMTRMDWTSVTPTSIVCGGTPCQDLSGAGKRAGMTEGTRSNLWVQMRECIAATRPDIVIWENVRGAFSAYAASDVEHEQGLLGETYGPDRPALRALGRVLGDLSDLGYDTEWVGVRASDVGAPHQRFRVFVLAYTRRLRGGQGWTAGPVEAASGWASANDRGRGLVLADTRGGRRDGRARTARRETLERVAVEGRGQDATADAGRFGGEHGRGSSDVVGTPQGAEGTREQRERDGYAVRYRSSVDWAEYGPAIDRWEHALGRVAPAPTEPGALKNGARRLSARFEEWMMGLPDGWVTDPAIGLTWGEQVKALGNGVVPQQALLALSILWPRVVSALNEAVAA